ncbi:hypothetical protein PG999_008460 [Apiospora kogelbergensis]|uniref:Rhodopsin domain-containing protein n=1 Tax=Apiospora kogelbergensis TaxID=1337665 RepID=A0AAW0QIW0_9PEZI
MFAMGGDAPMAMSFVWIMLGVLFLFLLLRLYTRVVLLAALGVDDYLYISAFIFAALSAALLQVSAEYGWGQTFEALIMAGRAADISTAVLWLITASTVSTVTMALAKLSLGHLLLRLMAVTMVWRRVIVWVIMALMVVMSFAYTVFVDVAFAILPWTFIPQLQMPRGEKYLVAGTMSLGILAGASGIKRTLELSGFWGDEILQGSVQTVVWSTVEADLTMLCIAIPVVLPLFRAVISNGKLRYRSRRSGYLKQSGDKASGGSGGGSSSKERFVLRTIGGGTMSKANSEVSA